MDFDNMIFPMGSTFIFKSWVYEADDEGNLHRCLIEVVEAHEDLTLLTGLAKDLAERFSSLTMPESTQAPTITDLNLVSGSDFSSESNLGSFGIEPSFFQLDSGTQHQLFKKSIRIYFKSLPRNWVISQPDSTTW
jgi:hypothetical protein